MELLEKNDPDKQRLIEASDRHKRELEKEVRSVTEKTEKMLMNALIIGGSLALTYFVISQFKRSKKKEKAQAKAAANGEDLSTEKEEAPSSPSLMSQIGDKLVTQATLILLDIAKEKLAEYLETRKHRNENS